MSITILPAGPLRIEAVGSVDFSGNVGLERTVVDTVLLAPDCAVILYSEFVSFEPVSGFSRRLVFQFVDPLQGINLQRVEHPVLAGQHAGDLRAGNGGGLFRIDEATAGYVFDILAGPGASGDQGWRFGTVSRSGALRDAAPALFGHGASVHEKSSGPWIYYDPAANAANVGYWTTYDDPAFTFWGYSLNLTTLTARSWQVFPGQGFGNDPNMAYYASIPLAPGKAFGADLLPDSSGDFSSVIGFAIRDNTGRTLDTVLIPGGEFGDDLMLYQIGTTTQVAAIYTVFDEDLEDSFQFLRVYETEPFALLRDSVRLTRAYLGSDATIGERLADIPYDLMDVFPAVNYRILGQMGARSPEHPNTAPVGGQDTTNGDLAVAYLDLNGFYDESLAGSVHVLNSGLRNGLAFYAGGTFNFFRRVDGEVVSDPYGSTFYQLMNIQTGAVALRLNQRTDGLGVSGHPRLVATQAPHAPRVGTTNVLN